MGFNSGFKGLTDSQKATNYIAIILVSTYQVICMTDKDKGYMFRHVSRSQTYSRHLRIAKTRRYIYPYPC